MTRSPSLDRQTSDGKGRGRSGWTLPWIIHVCTAGIIVNALSNCLCGCRRAPLQKDTLQDAKYTALLLDAVRLWSQSNNTFTLANRAEEAWSPITIIICVPNSYRELYFHQIGYRENTTTPLCSLVFSKHSCAQMRLSLSLSLSLSLALHRKLESIPWLQPPVSELPYRALLIQ